MPTPLKTPYIGPVPPITTTTAVSSRIMSHTKFSSCLCALLPVVRWREGEVGLWSLMADLAQCFCEKAARQLFSLQDNKHSCLCKNSGGKAGRAPERQVSYGTFTPRVRPSFKNTLGSPECWLNTTGCSIRLLSSD